MANRTADRLAKGADGTLWAVCGNLAYEIPVASQAVWDAFIAKLSPSPALTNPTKYPRGWSQLTLTAADDVSAAVSVAGPDWDLTLAPGNYDQRLKIVVPE